MIPAKIFAQDEIDTLLDENVKIDLEKPIHGPNTKNYFEGFYGFGYLIGNGAGSLNILQNKCASSVIGWSYKRKLSGLLSVGLKYDFDYTFISLNHKSSNFADSVYLTNTTNFKGVCKNKDLSRWSTDLHPFIRLNFNPHRGNVTGKFLEFGGGPGLNFVDRYYVRFDLGKVKTKTHYSGAHIANSFRLNSYVTLGLGIFQFRYSYQLSTWYNEKFNLPIVPTGWFSFVFPTSK